MTEETLSGRTATVRFTGTRSDLFVLLFRGYLLMLPTLGIYRFWLTTWKRHYYWMHTLIDGEPLEYTGRAMQLLIGFLFALAFFLPNYILFFYLSTQSPEIALTGYGIVGLILWFLTGYAAYRGRDFRFSRTLWRGIRFNQQGSAWVYALKRFLWTLLVGVTLGLAYPFMASSLWRYRWNHTWYGDRQMKFAGSWKTIAGPYYLVWFLIVASIVAVVAGFGSDTVIVDGVALPGPTAWLAMLGAIVVAGWAWLYFRAREASKMFSSIRLGGAAVTVRLRTLSLIKQYLLFTLALIGVLIVLFGVGGLIMFAVMTSVPGGLASFNPAQMAQAGWLAVAALVAGYLALLAAFAIMGETFLGYGYWMLVARNATISDAESLRTVHATHEDESVLGEGLADALNVGSY